MKKKLQVIHLIRNLRTMLKKPNTAQTEEEPSDSKDSESEPEHTEL